VSESFQVFSGGDQKGVAATLGMGQVSRVGLRVGLCLVIMIMLGVVLEFVILLPRYSGREGWSRGV
jgi:hypothetical protein